MKQKDLALLTVVVLVSAIMSLLISRTLFSSPKNRQQQVEVVQPITAEFPAPDTHYFYPGALDPAKLIQIGDNSNPNPFNSKQ